MNVTGTGKGTRELCKGLGEGRIVLCRVKRWEVGWQWEDDCGRMFVLGDTCM